MHLFNRPVQSASAFKLLILATVVCALAAIALTFSPSWLKKNYSPESTKVSNREYHDAPLNISQIPGNPTVTPTQLGEKPLGFPSDLPLYSEIKIIQSYQATRPDSPAIQGTIIYTSGDSAGLVINNYAKWLQAKGYSPKVFSPENPTALYLDADGNIYNISASIENNQTLVTISFTDTNGHENN